MLHLSYWWFHHPLHQLGWCWPSPGCTLHPLPSHWRLGSCMVLRPHPTVGLSPMHCGHLHAKVYWTCPYVVLPPLPLWPKHALHTCQWPTYGAKVQYIPRAWPHSCTWCCWPQTCSRGHWQPPLLCMCCWSNYTGSPWYSCHSAGQWHPSHMQALTHLLNYCAIHPDAFIHFHARNMVLWTHGNASYLMAPKGWLHAAGFFFLSSWPTTPPTVIDPAPPNNGLVHVLCQIMHQVMSSAAEAELEAFFLNAQTICPICTAIGPPTTGYTIANWQQHS